MNLTDGRGAKMPKRFYNSRLLCYNRERLSAGCAEFMRDSGWLDGGRSRRALRPGRRKRKRRPCGGEGEAAVGGSTRLKCWTPPGRGIPTGAKRRRLCAAVKGMREADIRLTTSENGVAETFAVRGACRTAGGEKLFLFRAESAEFTLQFGARVRIERKGEIAYTLLLGGDGDSAAEIDTPYGTIQLELRTLAQYAKESADKFEYRAEYEIVGAGEPRRREIIFTALCRSDGARKGGRS